MIQYCYKVGSNRPSHPQPKSPKPNNNPCVRCPSTWSGSTTPETLPYYNLHSSSATGAVVVMALAAVNNAPRWFERISGKALSVGLSGGVCESGDEANANSCSLVYVITRAIITQVVRYCGGLITGRGTY